MLGTAVGMYQERNGSPMSAKVVHRESAAIYAFREKLAGGDRRVVRAMAGNECDTNLGVSRVDVPGRINEDGDGVSGPVEDSPGRLPFSSPLQADQEEIPEALLPEVCKDTLADGKGPSSEALLPWSTSMRCAFRALPW